MIVGQFTSPDAAQYISHGNAGMIRVVVGLQIAPALRIGAKEDAQAQGRVYGDTAQAFDNFIDSPGWYTNGFGKCVQGDRHGFEPAFQHVPWLHAQELQLSRGIQLLQLSLRHGFKVGNPRCAPAVNCYPFHGGHHERSTG